MNVEYFVCLLDLPADLDYSITCVYFAAVVSGTEVNLALNKPAYQSSVEYGAVAFWTVGTLHVYLKAIQNIQ